MSDDLFYRNAIILYTAILCMAIVLWAATPYLEYIFNEEKTNAKSFCNGDLIVVEQVYYCSGIPFVCSSKKCYLIHSGD